MRVGRSFMRSILPLALARCRARAGPYTGLMKPRSIDPQRLDVEAFAREGATLEGAWPLLSLERLVGVAHQDAKPVESDLARWHSTGEHRAVMGGAPQTWLHLGATARLSLVCQRCLAPVETQIEAERSF